MEYVTLGKTGLRVSRVGFGGIPIQRVDAAAARELLDAVRAAGINYIDTARGYTVSEELIGQAIEGYRKDFVLATKSMSRDRDSMARDIGISLGNLRTDYIDLYQVHNPSPEQLEQNAAAMADRSPLSREELEGMERVRRELGTNFCRRCNYCAPCTVGISIPNAFLFHGYLSRYGLADWARDRYGALSAKAGDCVECGACEERCPYHLPIREMLKKVAADFGA